MNEPASFLLLIVGGVFLVTGFILFIKPPSEFNSFYGYRTIRSMKNQRSWIAGNQFASKLMMGIGFGDIILGYILSMFKTQEVVGYAIGMSLILISAFLVIIFTEQFLKANEEKNGSSTDESK